MVFGDGSGGAFEIVPTEERILSFWKEKSIYSKWKAGQSGKPRFTFIDGPPYPTGAIHLGTAWNKIMKDSVLRYKAMRGFSVNDTPGYDMHGLPVELKVEKEIGIKSKKQIEEYGVGNFVNYCRNFAKKNLAIMNGQFIRLGVWMDWENPYLTIENYYIEGVWWGIKQAYLSNYLVNGPKVLTACPRCETALAKHEQEYANITENSIFVKFPVAGAEKTFILIWTTTPWTLPTNMGVMVNPDFQYVYAECGGELPGETPRETPRETLILAKELAEKILAGRGYKIVKEVPGSELAGLKYVHPLIDEIPAQRKFAEKDNKNHSVVLSKEYVHLDAGTGCVHLAPGTGPEDFEVGKKEGLDMFCPIKLSGAFTEEAGKYHGFIAKRDADPKIIEDLEKKGLLFSTEKFTHEYPICWRCKTPLIFLATTQWFFSTASLKEKMREANKQVKWVPDWAGSSWFDSWLDNLQDWCISRQRYWGVPLPIWKCEYCGEIEVVGSAKELPTQPKDLHRPWIDEIKFACKKCKRDAMTRVPDIFDVWGEAGSASWAAQRFPAENPNVLSDSYPVDFIIEGKDQIRGWFNSLMCLGVLATGRAPYKAVYMHGFVNDEIGRKFSKSLGNFVSPEEVLPKYGADSLRMFFISSAKAGEDMSYSERYVRDAFNNLRILYNSYSFAHGYMSVDGFRPGGAQVEKKIEDKWILSRLNSLVRGLTEAFDNYKIEETSETLQKFFVNDLSRTYIKLIRERTWPGAQGEDKLAAYQTLYEVLSKLLRLSAPIVPMISEEIYQNFEKSFDSSVSESIHLCSWPECEEGKIDSALEEAVFTAQKVIEALMAARNAAGIKLRYPVAKAIVVSKEEGISRAISLAGEIISRLANCKKIEVSPEEPAGDYARGEEAGFVVFVDKKLDDALLGEAASREITRKIQAMRKDSGFTVSQKIVLELGLDEKAEQLITPFLPAMKEKVGAQEMELVRIMSGSKVFCDSVSLGDLGLGAAEIGFSREGSESSREPAGEKE
ncbi:MAG: isoleucine--tRNA ligase [archaeon]